MVTYNGHRALGPVTLSAQAGEHIVLVGESGAGKSSLLGLIREQVRENSRLAASGVGVGANIIRLSQRVHGTAPCLFLV